VFTNPLAGDKLGV